MKTPKIASEWRVLFRPEKHGNYVNDHCVYRDLQGKYQLFGISNFAEGPNASGERYFVHGSGDTLSAPLTEVGVAIDRGTLAWAPCVVEKDGCYYMFCGPSPTSLAVSPDGFEWFGTPVSIEDEPPMAIHRDHFILPYQGGYVMYAAGIKSAGDGAFRSSISAAYSEDLLHWRFSGFALTSGSETPLNPAWGAMESPFVVEKEGIYYLFVTYTNSTKENYHNTLVFASEDPTRFGEYNGGRGGAIPVAVLPAHAPEIITANGKDYITTCGWNGYGIPHEGCVSIAELDWE